MTTQPRSFAALMPVKLATHGKSRLAALGDPAREQLVLAFALDTISALLEAPSVALVAVVTDDIEVALACRDLGAEAIPDGGDELNDSLVQAAAEVSRRHPDLCLMAVVGDLPTLDPVSVEEASAAFDGEPMAFVPDAAGHGTTAYLAASYSDFSPRFGSGSAEAHRSSGAHELDLPGDCPLREDVDTPEELERARGRLGAHTRLALTQLGLEPGLR